MFPKISFRVAFGEKTYFNSFIKYFFSLLVTFTVIFWGDIVLGWYCDFSRVYLIPFKIPYCSRKTSHLARKFRSFQVKLIAFKHVHLSKFSPNPLEMLPWDPLLYFSSSYPKVVFASVPPLWPRSSKTIFPVYVVFHVVTFQDRHNKSLINRKLYWSPFVWYDYWSVPLEPEPKYNTYNDIILLFFEHELLNTARFFSRSRIISLETDLPFYTISLKLGKGGVRPILAKYRVFAYLRPRQRVFDQTVWGSWYLSWIDTCLRQNRKQKSSLRLSKSILKNGSKQKKDTLLGCNFSWLGADLFYNLKLKKNSNSFNII